MEDLWAKFKSGSLGQAVLQGLSGVMAVKVAGAALGFGSHVVLARLLDANQYGVYLYVWTWIVVLSQVTRMGFDNVLIRFVAEFNAQEKWSRLKGLLYQARRNVVIVSVLFALIGAGVILMMSDQLESTMRSTFLVGFILLPVYALNFLNQSVLRGLKRVTRANVPDLVIRHTAFVGSLAVLYLVIGQMTAPKAMALTLVVFGGVCATSGWWVYKFLPNRVTRGSRSDDERRWVRTALPYLLISGASLIESKTDLLTLGVFSTSTQVGVYGAAVRISVMVSFGLSAVNMTLAPFISELYSTGRKKQLRSLIHWITAGVGIFTVIVGAIVAVYGKTILDLFGAEFAVGYTPLMILVAGKAVGALTGPAGYGMMMTGHQGAASRIEGITAVANLAGNLALVPLYGALGAAVATAATHSLRNVVFALTLYRRIGINATIFNGDLLRDVAGLVRRIRRV